ncbi:MAG: bifunctional serine/threonine-protein kinase/formylglycine-generating enzyme family protein [Chloroflexota bacterium]|nr:bifunctional serine/threonine-protein kinase/formylglycine-generating enzyme family protein [Chloroflexota bacterium]
MSTKKDLIGQQIGQYRIIAPLGNGTSAMVYRAQQIRAFDRDVALKIMRPELLGEPTFAERLMTEARTIATLRHPNILRLIEYFTDDSDGEKLCLVMDYMPGGSLGTLMAEGLMMIARVETLCAQIAAALSYAHRQGVIHRDLKPQNVLLDESGNAMLSDFGIAKLLSENISMTRTGAIIGTPAYMSPEQWEGAPIDNRSDIYSFGVLVYEMLSGQLPFKADTATSMMFQHLHLYPQPIELLRDDLNPSVSHVLRRAIAKKREERYDSADAFFETLRSALHGETITVTRLSPLPMNSYSMPSEDDIDTMQVVEPMRASQTLASRPKIAAPITPQTPIPDKRRTGLSIGVITALVVAVAVALGVGALSRTTTPPVPTAVVGTSAPALPEGQRLDGRGVLQTLIPAGCFTMGSAPARDLDAADDELPAREVCLSAVWTDVYEVTHSDYQAFVDAGGYSDPSFWTTEGFAWLTSTGFASAEDRAAVLDGREPRINLSWYEADAYARWRGGRLPTEAEWEYAARGADARLYAWGDGYQLGYSIINESSRGGTAPTRPAAVGSRPTDRSWAGVYDLVGNACEWVNDWYASYPTEPSDDPVGAETGDRRVIRGGNYSSSPATARLVVRGSRAPDSRARACGVRVVTSAPES